MIKRILIAFGVAFGIAFALAMLEVASDTTFGPSAYVMPAAIGSLTFFILQMKSGNRKESRLDKAQRQASLSAIAPEGKALLYVYRDGFVGKAVGWNVSLDGAVVAQLKSPRFTQIEIAPGPHALRVHVDGFAGTQTTPGEATFEAKAGDTVVFAMKAKMGAFKSALSFVREADASAAVQKLARIPMVAAESHVGSNAA